MKWGRGREEVTGCLRTSVCYLFVVACCCTGHATTGGTPGPDPLRRPPPPPPCRVLAGKCRTMGAEGALGKFCLT